MPSRMRLVTGGRREAHPRIEHPRVRLGYRPALPLASARVDRDMRVLGKPERLEAHILDDTRQVDDIHRVLFGEEVDADLHQTSPFRGTPVA